MSTEPEPEPALAQEAGNGTTTLAVAMEEQPTTMTIPLERQRIVLQGWIDRQMLHSPSTKAYKELGERVAKLQQRYDKDCGAYRGRQLMQPALREAAMKKRAATVKAKHEAMVGDIVKRVTDALGADAAGKKKAAAAVADLFEPAEKAEPKKKKQKAKVAVEVRAVHSNPAKPAPFIHIHPHPHWVTLASTDLQASWLQKKAS